MKPFIIGLGGAPRSGKNTASRIILERFRGVEVAFADALRREVAQAWNTSPDIPALHEDKDTALFDMSSCRDEEFRKLAGPGLMRGRRVLQLWGTEYRRRQDPDYWVKRLAERIELLNEGTIVVTDVRFRNEVELIHHLNGSIIQIDRAGTVLSDHASDRPLTRPEYDYRIDNNWTIEALSVRVLLAVSSAFFVFAGRWD